MIVPELGVSDWRASRRFYCDILGFDCLYERPEVGFSYLTRGERVRLMIDQLGLDRTFEDARGPMSRPFGRGLNLEITVDAVAPLLSALDREGVALFLPLEDRWYRRDDTEVGNRQFVVADPDGYLLRFNQDLGVRPHQAGHQAAGTS